MSEKVKSPRLPSAFVALVLFIATGVVLQSSAVNAAVPSFFDSSFGTNGYVKATGPLQRSDTAAGQIITDSVGRLYTTISINPSMGPLQRVSIVRTSSDGAIDTAYGTQGRTVSVPLFATSIAIQPDNKIVIAGFNSLAENITQLQVLRYRTNGTLDTTFATAGVFTLNSLLGLNFERSPISLAVDSTNSRLILGTLMRNQAIQNTQFYFLALRFNGQVNTFWGDGGTLIVAPITSLVRGPSVLITISILSDGSMIAVGSAYNPNFQSIVLVKITPNGFLDYNFNGPSGSGHGLVVVPFASESWANLSALTVLSDGSLVLAGDAGTNNVNYFAMAKFTSAGIPDTSFGTNGFVLSTSVHASDAPQVSVVLQEANGDFIFPV